MTPKIFTRLTGLSRVGTSTFVRAGPGTWNAAPSDARKLAKEQSGYDQKRGGGKGRGDHLRRPLPLGERLGLAAVVWPILILSEPP